MNRSPLYIMVLLSFVGLMITGLDVLADGGYGGGYSAHGGHRGGSSGGPSILGSAGSSGEDIPSTLSDPYKINDIISTDSGLSAMIGGNLYYPNDSVFGGKIVKVSNDSIVVEYRKAVVTYQDTEKTYKIGDVLDHPAPEKAPFIDASMEAKIQIGEIERLAELQRQAALKGAQQERYTIEAPLKVKFSMVVEKRAARLFRTMILPVGLILLVVVCLNIFLKPLDK